MRKSSNNSKWQKKDYYNLLILVGSFILLIILMLKKGDMLASSTDWPSQHSAIPEYFRALFYKTFDFFPNLALNLGGGQNIYNYAYYGLFNPLILLSYLFPFLKMEIYIMISTSASILASIILFYKFLRNHKFSSLTALISSFTFLGASSLMFHLHRHIMFVDYMPFLLMALMGVDKYFKNKKSSLLVLGIFLMILTSYYYAVGGLVAIVIYGIFVYLSLNRKFKFKNFLIEGLKFMVPLFIAIMMTMVLILPTLLVIFGGRENISVAISLKEILLPSFNLGFILYRTYGVGLASIALFSLLSLFFQRKEEVFLATVLSSLVVFPIFVYLFNAGMYLDSKVLIPFLPLYCYTIALFMENLQDKKTNLKVIIFLSLPIIIIASFKMGNLKYVLLIDALITIIALLLSRQYRQTLIVGIPVIIMVLGISLYSSKQDTFLNYQNTYGKKYQNQAEIINKVTTEDNSFYRIANNINPTTNTNRIFGNLDYYQSTIYSSTYNVLYKDFFVKVMHNPFQSRNQFILSSPKNYPFLLLMGHKYLLTQDPPYMGYLEYAKVGNLTMYKNDNALPLAYASANLVNIDIFNKLSYPYNQEIILNNVIVEDKVLNNISTHLEETTLDLDLKELAKLNYKKTNGVYVFSLDEEKTINLPLKKPLNNELLYISFELLESNSCAIGDTTITINGLTNKLTCETWKYHNQNYNFDYVLSTDEIANLEIKLSKGNYKIKNLKTYTLDYGYVNNLNDKVDEFIFDKNKTKGDIIEGNIEVKKDGYFVLSVPYDKGYKVYVDGIKQATSKVNIDLLGFPIKEGNHHIKIIYTALGSRAGLMISLGGVGAFIGLIVYENKDKFKKKRG